MGATRPRLPTLAFLLVCIAILGGLRWWFGGVAPTPNAFAAHASLDAALAQSEQNGRPVLAFATADWCRPCQTLKRGALADPGLNAWIGEHTNPALIDLTRQDDPDAGRAARLLEIASVPALVLLVDGEIAARIEGVVSADRLQAWLAAAVPPGEDAAVTPAG